MRELLRPLLLVTLVLAVPIVPFAFFGASLEQQTLDWLDRAVTPGRMALLTVSVLASDLLLPVPSSVVSTLAGARLGVLGGTLASWTGMTAGGIIAFALARWLGRPFAERMAGDEASRLEKLATEYGALLVVGARALPVLAEASVLLVGAMRLSWRAFLPALVLSNLGIALAYAVFGVWAERANAVPAAIVASIAIPVLATTIARWWLARPVAVE
ncbi:MAG: VTT domain-containing protein [Pirellulales bacterium]|nr:VTT domain-containing protein [Pirellulales bacterium]